MRKEPAMNLGTVIANATMQHAANILREQCKSSNDYDMDVLIDALRTEAKAALGRVMDQGKALLETGNAGWLRKMVEVETLVAAKAAVEAQ